MDRFESLTRKNAIPLNWNMQVFSTKLVEEATQPKKRSSAQSQLDRDTIDHNEQLNYVQLGANMVDEFNVIDLEFKRVELSRLLTVKLRELDEAVYEKE
jgi:hypothetical protein